MVAIFSGFIDKEIPKESFIVIEVLRITVNKNLDARNIERGNMVLMKQDKDIINFFE